jgi:hypothetical protein
MATYQIFNIVYFSQKAGKIWIEKEMSFFIARSIVRYFSDSKVYYLEVLRCRYLHVMLGLVVFSWPV